MGPGTRFRRLSPFIPWASAVLLVLFLALKMSPVATPAKWDECAYVYDAQRLLDGQVPYRDFFNFVPPGTFLAQSGWYALWGERASLTLGRLLAGLVTLLTALVLYRLLRRTGWNPAASCLWAGLYPLGLYAFWAVPSHHWFANACFLGSLLALDPEKGEPGSNWGWLTAGLGAGGACLFLQTIGLEALLFWGTLLLLTRAPRLPKALGFGAGCGLIGAPILLWLWIVGALGPSVGDVVMWTIRSYGRKGGPNAVGLLEDWPDRLAGLWSSPPPCPAAVQAVWAVLSSLALVGILALGLILLAAALWVLGRSLRNRSFSGGLSVPALVLVVVEFGLFLRGKTDWLHFLYGLGPVGVVWLMAAGPWERWSARWRRGVATLAVIALTGSFVLHSGRLLAGFPEAWEFLDVDRPVREAPVNRWLRAQPWLLPQDRIAAFPEGGEVYLYVRPAAVGFTQFLPMSENLHGIEDNEEVAGQIQGAKARCVLLTVDLEPGYLDPSSPVGRELRAAYGRHAVIADVAVYLRKGSP